MCWLGSGKKFSGVAALAGRVRRGNHVRRDEPLLDGHREVIGSFEDFEDVDLDEVTPLSLAVLQCASTRTQWACLTDGERSQPPRAVRVRGRRSSFGTRRVGDLRAWRRAFTCDSVPQGAVA